MVSDPAIGGIIVGGVTALNLAFTFGMRWRERADRKNEREADDREWYRRTMFEKRVYASQEEHSWLLKLRNAGSGINWKDPAAERNERLRTVSREARPWWDLNALLLDSELPESSWFVGTCNAAFELARGEEKSGFWQDLHKADIGSRERARTLMSAEREGAS